MTADIINQLINQYTGSIVNIQAGSIDIGKELFSNLALMSLGLLGLTHLLRKNVDMAEAHLDLIKWLIYLDIFYLFITNYYRIYPCIFNAILQIGNYLGAKAGGGNVVDITPANMLHIGFTISKSMLANNVYNNLFRNLPLVFISLFAAAVVLYCFAVIGLELILVQIGSQIILAGGLFLLAFSGLQWTRDYAERYVHTFFHIGIKMIFIYILVGIGAGLAQSWSQVIKNASIGQIIDYDIAVCLSTFIYYKLCIKIPDQAVSFLTGRLSMGFDSAASVNAVVKGIAKIPAAAVGLSAGVEGISKAVSVAGQLAKTSLESQGKKDNLLNSGWETVKTLGEANKEIKQEAWDRKVDDTRGGKIAKNIMSKLPKPAEDPPKEEKEVPEDSMDYSI